MPENADTVRPYYEVEGVTIYHGDCLDVLPKLAPVDLVVTSPAYNLGVNPGGQFGHWKDGDNSGGKAATRKWSGHHGAGIGYDCHADAMPYPEYRAWQHEVLRSLWAGLTDRGAIYYNHRPRVQRDGLLLPLDLNPDLPIRQIITWARAGGYCYTPTAYVPMYEWIIVFAKQAFRLRERKASGAGDLWQIPQETNPLHPAPFPVALPARAIETTGAGTVLDPFLGSGSTLVAARLAGVRGIGIEINERYCEVAATRLAALKEGVA